MEFFEDMDDKQLEETIVRLVPLDYFGEPQRNPPGYYVYYCTINPYNNRRTVNRFVFNPPRNPLSYEMLLELAQSLISKYKPGALTGLGKKDPRRLIPRSVKAELNRVYKSTIKSKLMMAALKDNQLTSNEEPDRKQAYYTNPKILVRKHDDNGKTHFVAGRSFSGKSYFLTAELNKLKGLKRGGNDKHVKNRPMYERIYLMTSSPNAQPFKDLDKSLNVKIIPMYVPKLIALFKRINDATINKLPFLLALDDVFSDMRSNTFNKLLLTLRNANISTIALSQYFKHLTPQARNSCHNVFVTKFQPEEWEYYIKSTLKYHVQKMMGVDYGVPKLAEKMGEFLDQDILHYNAREDKINIIPRSFNV